MLSETKADDVVDALHRLGQHAMAHRVGSWLEDPMTRHASTLSCLYAITQAQEQENAGKRAQCFLQKAQLAPSASIETVHTGAARGLTKKLLADLKEGDWLRRGQNLVVTGPAGVGKTYLATALAWHALVTHRAKVVHHRMPELLRKCSEAEATGGWTKLLTALARPDLVVLEHFALEPIAIDDTRRLVEWLDARERNERPTLVVAPTPPDEWDDYFAGDTARSLLLRRLLKEATVIEVAPIARKAMRSE